MASGSIYVIGEDPDDGPVKIGMTYNSGGAVGRGGLNVGNWRALVPLERIDVPSDQVRWREWLTLHRLRHRHVRGEWFDVRDLATSGWERLLDDVWGGTHPNLHPLQLGSDEHHITDVRQPVRKPRQFNIACSCGATVDGEPGRALPTALRAYATAHCGLPARGPVVAELTVEPAHKRFNLNPYQPNNAQC